MILDDQADGTIKIHESEQLPNGLYRNVARTITARTDFATITDEMSSGIDDHFHAYTETTVKKYNQANPLSYDDGDDAIGRIRKQESTPNEDGTFNTIETTRTYQGFSRFYNTKDKHYLVGYHLNPNSEDGFKYTGESSGTTFENLRGYVADFKGTFDVVDNDDGTVSYKAVLSKDVADHTLTVRKGGKVTETIEYLRDTTDGAIDTKLAALSGNNTAGTVVNVQRITGENGSLDAILSRTVTDSSSVSKSYNNSKTQTEYEFGFGASSVPNTNNNLADGKNCVLQASQREDGLYDYVKTTTTTASDSRYYTLRNQIILLGHHVSTDNNTGFKTPSHTSGTTYANFKNYVENKDAQVDIRENDDNTIDYIVRINDPSSATYTSQFFGDNEIQTKVINKINQASLPSENELEDNIATDGTEYTKRSLRGPNGVGVPIINADGTKSFSIVEEKKIVTHQPGIKNITNGKDFYIKAFSRKVERNLALRNTSFQQIQRRIGGELEYEKDERGNLVGVNWSADWDLGTNANNGTYPSTTAPDNWISDGYHERYGEWKGHYVKTYMVGEGSLIAPVIPTATCRGYYQSNATYQIGDVVYSEDTSSNGPGNTEDWYIVTTAPIWNYSSQGSYSEGTAIRAGNLIYTVVSGEVPDQNGQSVDNRNFPPTSTLGQPAYTPGASGKAIRNANGWSTIDDDLIKQKIGIDGSGFSVFKEIDYHIPIQKETSREVLWNTDWEYDANTAYAVDDYVFHVATQQTYRRKSAGTGTTPGTNPFIWEAKLGNPTGWDSGGYKAKHGDWQGRFTKSFKTGVGSSLNSASYENAGQNRGEYSSSVVYQIGDLVLTQTNAANKRHAPNFYSLHGSNVSLFNDSSTYDSGDVVRAGNKLYTSTGALDPANYDYSVSPTSAEGNQYWSEGALGSALDDHTENDSDWILNYDTAVLAVIGNKNAGEAPFEAICKSSSFRW